MEARVFEAWPLVPGYSPAVGTPRDLSVSAALRPHQAQMPGQMLAAQGHIASPRLKHSHGISVARIETPNTPPDVETRVWMAEKVGHECHHFLAVPAVVADHLDGGID